MSTRVFEFCLSSKPNLRVGLEMVWGKQLGCVNNMQIVSIVMSFLMTVTIVAVIIIIVGKHRNFQPYRISSEQRVLRYSRIHYYIPTPTRGFLLVKVLFYEQRVFVRMNITLESDLDFKFSKMIFSCVGRFKYSLYPEFSAFNNISSQQNCLQ